MLKKHIRPTLGTLPLAEITRGQVKDLLATKRSEGLSKNAVRLVRATLSGLYADAIDAELVTANPAARTGRARGRKTPDAVSAAERRGKVRAMTVEQLAAFLKAAKTGRHATLFLLLADTGMRPGEAFALTWKDIDLAPRVINVERAVARGGRLKGTKTDSARGGPDAAPGPWMPGRPAWRPRPEPACRGSGSTTYATPTPRICSRSVLRSPTVVVREGALTAAGQAIVGALAWRVLFLVLE